jgi:alanine-glyoxylate transaminase / serine-glyoxylate transaminase / serine-pyruvate transaminase
VTIVHAETSTGVLNPVQDVAATAREHGALVIVDAVTSLGAMPLDVAGWKLDVVYSCSQKGLGAPSGVAPIVFAPTALERRVPCRSFAFDLTLLEDYWLRRKYHHTMCASLIYSLREALMVTEEEGLPARWARHERHHLELAGGLAELGLSLLPPPGERLWTLNAVRVPDDVDEAAVRRYLLEHFNMEIGAGLGPRPDGHELDRSAGDAVPVRSPAGAPQPLSLNRPPPTTVRGDAEDRSTEDAEDTGQIH